MIKNLGKLKILKLLLVSVTLSSAAFANSVHSNQQKPVSKEEIDQILQNPKQVLAVAKQLILNRRKVGVKLEQVNRLMARLIDSNAEFDTTTFREAEQEISDRIRQAIEKFEEQHDVCVVVYHESKKDLENVTADFIKETFPHAIVPSGC